MNLAQLSLGELAKLKQDIDDEVVMRHKRVREALRQRFADMALQAGYSLPDVLETKPAKTTQRLIWRDRRNGIEWAGRGRQPNGFSKQHAVQISA